MKQLKVSNQKLQAKLDAITGWLEFALVIATIAITIFGFWLAFYFNVL